MARNNEVSNREAAKRTYRALGRYVGGRVCAASKGDMKSSIAFAIPIALLASFGIVWSLLAVQPAARSSPQAECEADTNFIWIPAGEFIFGSDRAERDFAYRLSAETAAPGNPERIAAIERNMRRTGWFEGEFDRQTRSLPSYCLAKTLVTNADYLEFVEATGHRIPDISPEDYRVQGFLVHPYSTVEEFLWQERSYPAGEGDHPVVLVSYEDAVAYARWRSDRDGTQYRLPSEAEWEKAARGTEGRYFPWGNDWQRLATNVAPGGPQHTSAIAAYPLSRSVYGIEDMAGIVFEYTSTVLERNGRSVSVMKGCSWDDSPGFCRGAYRHTRPVDSRHILFGFRLVREL